MKYIKIDLNEYLQKGGELHCNESIYDEKENFIGTFDTWDLEKFELINVKTPHGIIKINRVVAMVEIECTPIYVAL